MSLECSECGKDFTTKQNLNKHMLMHTWEKSLSCKQCGEKFLQKVSLKKHMLCHGDEKCFKCELCGNVYSANKNLKRHLKTCGSAGSLSKTKCLHPSCEKQFFHVTKMIHHLESQHSGMKVEANEIHFQSLVDFGKWKEEEECRTHTYFSRASGKTHLKGAVYWYFTCQHDGSARFHCKKGEAGRLTKRKWAKGRVKTGLTCPSRIMAKQFNDGRVSVKYISTHSHEITSENKKFQPLSGTLLNLVKQQLAKGVTPKEIQMNLQKGHLLGNDVGLKKDQVVTLKQLNQLKRKLWLRSKPGLSDLCSLVSLVNKLKESPSNPVIVYKPQGQNILCGNANLAELPNFEDLVAIGLQTEDQLELMRNGILKVVSVVAMNWFKETDIYMLSLVVPDEHGVGHPIAHFITNHRDDKTLQCLFFNLLERCPQLKISAIMTDESEFGLSALRSVFGDTRHILCQGHTRHILQEKIQKLVNCHKTRYELSAFLDVLLYEREEEIFQQMCFDFQEKYSKFLPAFMEYFCDNFLRDQLKWASCYRRLPQGNFDSVQYCEAFKSRLKGQRERNCDNSLADFVLTLLAMEQVDSSSTANGETNRHIKGIQIPDNQVSKEGEVWKISMASDHQGFNYVTQIAEVCREDLCFERCMDFSCAGLCSHLYVCDCEDVAGLCTHVHKVHSLDFRIRNVLPQYNIWGDRNVVCLKSEQELYYEHEQEIYCGPAEVVYGKDTKESYCGNELIYNEQEPSIYIAHEQGLSLKQESDLYYEQEIFIEHEQEISKEQEQNSSEQAQFLVYEENRQDTNQTLDEHCSKVEIIKDPPERIETQVYKLENIKESKTPTNLLPKKDQSSNAIITNIDKLKDYMKDPRVKKLLLSHISGTVNQLVMRCEALSPTQSTSPSTVATKEETLTPSITVIDDNPSPSISSIKIGHASSTSINIS